MLSRLVRGRSRRSPDRSCRRNGRRAHKARAQLRHARHSRPEDRLARAMGRCRQRPCLAQHHRAPDRRANRLSARRRARAVEESHPARRDGLGRDRRHGLLVGRGQSGADPYRRRQSQRQQIHRQQRRPIIRSCATIRSASSSPAIIPMSRSARPRRRSRPGRSWSRCCARVTASRSTTSMPTTGSTSRTPAIAKAAGSRRWRGRGGVLSRRADNRRPKPPVPDFIVIPGPTEPSPVQGNALGRSAEGFVTIWCASRQITSR